MRHLILSVVMAAAAMTAAMSTGHAQYYPWCLVIDDKLGSSTCYFTTRDQCMMSAGGNGGHCVQNPAYREPSQPPRRRRNSR